MTAISDVAYAAAGARLAVLASAGDESGVHSLALAWTGEPELAADLIALARELLAMFNQSNPGGLEAILRALEDDLARQLDDDGDE